ncbi:MAG: adenosine deaminase [Pseudomonadota bacterium]
MIPKAELHVHINGTIRYELLTKLAKRNGIEISDVYYDQEGNVNWVDYSDFHEAYSAGSAVVKNPEDFADVAYDYLRQCHEQGAIYVELMASPDKSKRGGKGFDENLHGIIDGIERAKRDFGIESRIILTAKRHRGPKDAWDMLRAAKKSLRDPRVRHHVTGFGMAGDEQVHRAIEFRDAFKFAKEKLGLRNTVHAGEALGADGVWEVVNHLPIERIGHGVRSVEDEELVQELAERGLTLEVCLRSNMALGVYPEFKMHPINELRKAGVKVTVNSDDPALFGGSIADEYKLAEKQFGMNMYQQLQLTKTAIEAAFVDDATQYRLLKVVDKAFKCLDMGADEDHLDEGPIDKKGSVGKQLRGGVADFGKPGDDGYEDPTDFKGAVAKGLSEFRSKRGMTANDLTQPKKRGSAPGGP